MFSLKLEQQEDWWEVEALYDLCFAPGREALSSYRLRDNVEPLRNLCLVARDDFGAVAGAIRFWPVLVGQSLCGLLGPIAVYPTHQGEGLGALLIQNALLRAPSQGITRVILVGDAPYYGRFGFARLDTIEMPPPTNPERVLGLALADDAWQGVQGKVQRAE